MALTAGLDPGDKPLKLANPPNTNTETLLSENLKQWSKQFPVAYWWFYCYSTEILPFAKINNLNTIINAENFMNTFKEFHVL